MLFDEHLYLDRVQLAARGWTRALTERFLPNPDRWMSVGHWLNYTGKATYFIEKVMAAEQLTDFKTAFAASVVRRRWSAEQVEAAMQERAQLDATYRKWIRSVRPEDVELMLVFEEAAAALASARALGVKRQDVVS